MGRVYLNKQDLMVLNMVAHMNLSDKYAKQIENILKREEENRLHINNISKEYKRKKRAIDKNYARSKKEKGGKK